MTTKEEPEVTREDLKQLQRHFTAGTMHASKLLFREIHRVAGTLGVVLEVAQDMMPPEMGAEFFSRVQKGIGELPPMKEEEEPEVK